MKQPRLHRSFLLVVALFLISHIPVFSQDEMSIAELEVSINELHGTERLAGYHRLAEYYMSTREFKKALRFARRGAEFAEIIITPENKLLVESDFDLKPKSYIILAAANEQRGYFEESRRALVLAVESASKLENDQLRLRAERDLTRMDSLVAGGTGKKRLLGPTLSTIGSAVSKGTDDISANATWELAEYNESKGNLSKAIDNYKELQQHYTDLGDWAQVNEIRIHIAELYEQLGKLEEAVEELQDARLVFERAGDTTNVERIYARIDSGTLKSSQKTLPEKIEPVPTFVAPAFTAPPPPQNIDPDAEQSERAKSIRSIAEEAERSADFETSLNYYKEYMTLQESLAEQLRLKQLDSVNQINELDQRQREITLLQEKENSARLRLEKESARGKSLLIGLILSAVVLVLLYFLYNNNKRDHKRLGKAYDNLSRAQSDLKNAERRIKHLLNQQISGEVADELLATDDRKVARKFVCIMFLDIREFTKFAEKLLPEEIIDYQNQVFAFMIEAVNRNGGIVNQILGDGFMATFGAPVSKGNDCLQAFKAAREIMETVSSKSKNGDISPTRVGIGLHAGHVVTGNVGTEERKQYSITGNTVIIAARLEQLNKEFGSTMVISKEVYDRLPDGLKFQVTFKEVQVKGRTEPVEVTAIFEDSKLDSPAPVAG